MLPKLFFRTQQSKLIWWLPPSLQALTLPCLACSWCHLSSQWSWDRSRPWVMVPITRWGAWGGWGLSALSFTGELGSCVLGRKPCRGAVPSHPVMRAPLPRWAALTGFPHHPLVLLPLFLYCFLGPAVVCLWHGPLRAPGWAESGRDSMENVVWPPPGSEPCPQLRGWGSWAGRRSVRPDMGIHTWPLSKAGAVPGALQGPWASFIGHMRA